MQILRASQQPRGRQVDLLEVFDQIRGEETAASASIRFEVWEIDLDRGAFPRLDDHVLCGDDSYLSSSVSLRASLHNPAGWRPLVFLILHELLAAGYKHRRPKQAIGVLHLHSVQIPGLEAVINAVCFLARVIF